MPQEPTKVADIVVIGARIVPTALVPGGTGGGGGIDGNPEPELVDPNAQPGGGVSQMEADAENERQKDCAAQAFEETLKTEHNFSKEKREFFAFMWTRAGSNVTHPPEPGTGDVITLADRDRVRQEYGIAYTNVTGFVHNHPQEKYCPNSNSAEEIPNMYPSDADVAFADQLVNSLGVVADDLTLYIMDCDGATRSFRYRDRDAWLAAKARRDVPPPLEPECEGTP